MPLIELYLEDKEFVNGGPAAAVGFYTHTHEVPLPANYSGPIPILAPFRYNHSCDNALQDEAGGLKCTSVGLEVLLQHNLLHHPQIKVLDIHGATENGCSGTVEGYHYTSAEIVRRELTLLLKGLRSIQEG
jgi:hypothetical protein